MSAVESLAPPTQVELILDAVRRRIGETDEVWVRLATMPSILKSRWGELFFLLDGKVIPTEVAWILGYEAALGDGCPKCVESMRRILAFVGFTDNDLADAETLKRGGKWGFQAKFLLAYGAVCANDPHRMSKKVIDSLLEVHVPEQELLQAAETVSFFRSLFDLQHLLGLHYPQQEHKKPRRFKLKKEHLR